MVSEEVGSAHEAFARRLETRMAERGFNMKSLSLAAGLGETAVRDILKRHSSPSADKVMALATTLGVSAGWLLDAGRADNLPDGQVSATVAEIPEEAGSPASGNRIAEARKQRGLTQTQLAEALGTGRSQIVKLERGERRLTVDWARRIATALGVEVSALIDGEMPSEVPMPSSHTILIRRAAIQAAERIVAMAGPINAAPRDVVRQIVTEAFGFWMESDGDPR